LNRRADFLVGKLQAFERIVRGCNAAGNQMLHGIRRDLQQGLVRDGWRMRVYIPFGTEWYPYLMRRLAERPANVLFIAKNLLRQ
jgi:proline dehydrogenase